MDLGFGKFRQFYIVNMIFRSIVTSFHAKSWDSRNMKCTNPWETYLPVGTFRNGSSFVTGPRAPLWWPTFILSKGRAVSRAVWKTASFAHFTALRDEFEKEGFQPASKVRTAPLHILATSTHDHISALRTTPSRLSASLHGSCSFFPLPSFSSFLFSFFPSSR